MPPIIFILCQLILGSHCPGYELYIESYVRAARAERILGCQNVMSDIREWIEAGEVVNDVWMALTYKISLPGVA
jgi:hypothetical protein